MGQKQSLVKEETRPLMDTTSIQKEDRTVFPVSFNNLLQKETECARNDQKQRVTEYLQTVVLWSDANIIKLANDFKQHCLASARKGRNNASFIMYYDKPFNVNYDKNVCPIVLEHIKQNCNADLSDKIICKLFANWILLSVERLRVFFLDVNFRVSIGQTKLKICIEW